MRTLNRSHPLANGLVGFWPSDASSVGGQTWVDAASGMAAGITGATWRRRQRHGTPANVGATLDFNASTDIALVPSNARLPTTAASVAFWYRHGNNVTGNGSTLLGRRNLSDNYGWWIDIGIAINQFIIVCWGPGGVVYNGPTFTSLGLTVGDWYHFTGVWPAAGGATLTVRVPKTGVVTTTTIGGAIGSTVSSANFVMGRNQADSVSLVGGLADVQVWNRGLSSAEVAANYQESLAGFPTLLPARRPRALDSAPASGPATSFSSTSALSTAGAAAVAFGLSISSASAMLTGGSAAINLVGPPLTISSSSGLLTGGSAAVSLTSPNIAIASSSALLTGGSASVAFAASTAVSISTASAMMTGGSASVVLTGTRFGPQRAVYADIVARLVELNCFAEGGVGRGAPSEVLARSSRQYPCAAVQPLTWVDSDRYDEGDFIRTCTFTITLIVRMEEPEARQDWLDYLADRVCNALDGQCLGGVSFQDMTLIQRGQYGATPQHPEQRATLTGQFAYEVVGYGARDETEPT